MERSHLSLEELWPLIPDLRELDDLRLLLASASAPDPAKAWDRSRGFATVDKRVISQARVESVVADARESAREYVDAIFSILPGLFAATFAGDAAGAATHLVELGEKQEAVGRHREARLSFEAALRLTLALPEKEVQVLALRRIGRVALAQGELNDALLHYRRSGELARDAGDLRGEVIAETGYGNVLLMQGRWPETERHYRVALERLTGADAAGSLLLERAQLFNNMAMILTHLERFEEASGWFERALGEWARIDSPTDLAICYYNQGLMLDRQGRLAEAREAYERGLALDVSPAVRATTAIALAECLLQEGDLAGAEARARVAEEYALAARSPYRLGHMYRGLGNIARAKGDADGFVFFEKALEIARGRGYLPLEAETLLDYAQLRSEIGEREEAESYLEHALAIYRRLGITHEKARAERILRTIGDPAAVRRPGAEEPPGP